MNCRSYLFSLDGSNEMLLRRIRIKFVSVIACVVAAINGLSLACLLPIVLTMKTPSENATYTSPYRELRHLKARIQLDEVVIVLEQAH